MISAMRIHRLILAALALAALAACGDTVPEASAPARDLASTDGLTQEQQGYIAELGAIDPGLIVNTDRAIRRGENTCDMLSQEDIVPERAISQTVERMSGGNATINEEQAQQVIDAAQRYLCA